MSSNVAAQHWLLKTKKQHPMTKIDELSVQRQFEIKLKVLKIGTGYPDQQN